MKNQLIAQIFNNIADILELQEVQWKPQAYRNAAMSIGSLSEDVEDIYERGELKKISGVGEHIAKKIEEIIKTGKLKYYEKLKKQVKVDIENLGKIPGLGSKKIKVLYKKLKVKNIKDLEKVIKAKKLRKLAGFGEKTEELLLEGIKLVKNRPKRFLYLHAMPVVEQVKSVLGGLKFVDKIEIAGSFRRGKETIGDLDFLVVSKQPGKVMRAFTSMPDVKRVIAKGSTRGSVLLVNNMQVDLRIVKEKEWGSALLYFIGNKEHNIGLRKLALRKGYTLSEYGLFKIKAMGKGKKWVAGRSEEEVYKKLGVQYMPPELRENMGEIKAALAKKIPKLITNKDVKGLFHTHSNWSDGNNTLLEMAKEAEKIGMKFISFNDHYGDVTIANPLDEKRLKKYLAEINKVRKKVGIRVFSGVEIDILKDGTLPLPAKKLKGLDMVIASVHMATRMDEARMTKRICRALDEFPIDALGHPTDRLLNERPGLKINLDKVFACAKKNDVFLEINASPRRLDLNGENIKKAKEVGCKFIIATDAHDASHQEFYPLGVNMARRGWLEKKDVLNCWTLGRIEKILKK